MEFGIKFLNPLATFDLALLASNSFEVLIRQTGVSWGDCQSVIQAILIHLHVKTDSIIMEPLRVKDFTSAKSFHRQPPASYLLITAGVIFFKFFIELNSP